MSSQQSDSSQAMATSPNRGANQPKGQKKQSLTDRSGVSPAKPATQRTKVRPVPNYRPVAYFRLCCTSCAAV